MAIEITSYDILQNDTSLADDRYDYFTIEQGGTITVQDSIGDQTKNENILNIDDYTFRIFSNVEGASIYVNGEEQNKVTPNFIRFKKSDLFRQGESKTITVRKNGYRSDERYEIFISSIIDKPIEEITLSQDDSGFINLRNIDIKIRYFVGDQLIEFNNFNNTITPLGFNLKRIEEPTRNERTLKTSLTGDDGSVVLERVRDGQIFPISSNRDSRSDNRGTRYVLRSVDTSAYRVAAIRLQVDGKTEELTAGDGESLKTEIKLNNNIELAVATQRLVIKENIQPRLRIDNGRARTINKNEKSGVPIVLEKNSVVNAISVIIGDDIYEYKDLGKKSRVVITLPQSAFDRLGSYNVKLFPYSISQLESFTKD